MPKPKVAFYWCASCGGCEEAVINLDEELLNMVDAFDIALWPGILDYKRKDIEAIGDNEIAASFISGAISLGEQEIVVKLLRQRSQLVFAFGACAHIGGIPGLGNLYTKDAIIQRAYKEVPAVENPEGITPQEHTILDTGELALPVLSDTTNTLDQVIPVDYYLPGCPPPPDIIKDALDAILKKELPEKGVVLAPDKPLCDTCPRAEERREGISIQEIKRPHEIKLSPWKCFLEQGIICLGSVTRTGCGERCIKANMPCRGCMGPAQGTIDQGAKAVSIVASVLGLEEEEEMTEEDINKLLDGIVDPAGTFYRFSLPASLLVRRKRNRRIE